MSLRHWSALPSTAIPSSSLRLQSEAMELWHEAHERRTGRRPATPQLDSSVRAARAARALLEGRWHCRVMLMQAG